MEDLHGKSCESSEMSGLMPEIPFWFYPVAILLWVVLVAKHRDKMREKDKDGDK